ncbi:S-layer homology domain-containing protein [Brevibacillus laterosporus]|nr:S-layer homology domain-containing protein [Brevibacillus laterosporus]MDN9009173.1 S-layer homology domain-containing protein [Brevibacillus laterosporus]MDO0939942.1 S-layer homology domain-containing protein [Brevibacillus laterosporus]
MKKVVNSLLASALALSVVPVVAGAEEAAKTTEETKTTAPQLDPSMEKVIQRLKALGLATGDEKGNLNLDQPIKRSEFATLMVRARGLEQAANTATFNPFFKDVTASDWFKGWVSIAVSQDLTIGYPDKTFRPDKLVTYAEAATMLVRALGYEPLALQNGTWPNNFISQASTLKITDGVTIDPDKPAVRGDVMKMLDNSLRVDLMKQTTVGSQNNHEVLPGKNLLTEYLHVHVYDTKWTMTDRNRPEDLPSVSNVPVIGLGSLKYNEVELTSDSKSFFNKVKYKVADSINANDYAGQRVQVWIKDRDNTVVWMEGSEDETVVFDKYKAIHVNGKKLSPTKDKDQIKKDKFEKLTLELDSEKKYDFAEDVTVTFNFERATKASDVQDALQRLLEADDAYSVKLVLNTKNEIRYLSIVDDRSGDQKWVNNHFGSELIKKVSEKKITTLVGQDLSLDGKKEGVDYLVFLDGKPAKLADLKEMDVYHAYRADGNKDKLLIFANRTTKEGKVEKVRSKSEKDFRIVIDGKEYRFRNASFAKDKDKEIQDNITTDEIDSLEGTKVKIYLDAVGRIRHIEGYEANDRKQLAIISRSASYEASTDRYIFKVWTEKDSGKTAKLEGKYIKNEDGKKFSELKGSKTESQLAKDYLTLTNDKKFILAEVELDANGDIEKVNLKDTSKAKHMTKEQWNKNTDKSDETVRYNGKSYDFGSSSVAFDGSKGIESGEVTSLKSPKVIKWSKIAEKDAEVYFTLDGSDIEAVFVVDSKGLASGSEYGVVVEAYKSSGSDYLKIKHRDKDGKWVETPYKYDGDGKEKLEKTFIRYSADSSDLIEEDDIRVIVDARGDEYEYKTIKEKDYEDAGVHFVAPAIVDKVESKKIYFSTATEKKLSTKLNKDVVYFDKDGKQVDEPSDEDYVVLVDTDDNSDDIDYVLYVISHEEAKEQGYLKKDENKETLMDQFLKQKWNGEKPDPSEDGDLDITKQAASEVLPGVYGYEIAGKLTGDLKDEKEVTIVLGDKEFTAEVKDGKFEFTKSYKKVDEAYVKVGKEKFDLKIKFK